MSTGRSDGYGLPIPEGLAGPGGGSSSCIDVIGSFHRFCELRDAWEAVYAADPEAQFFLSWTWMEQWLKALKTQWFILAAKSKAGASDYVAFFPLRLRAKTPHSEITMAGNRAADYTGFICAPEFQKHAIPAFAKHIRKLNWAIFNLEFIRASNERIGLFLEYFPRENFYVNNFEKFNKKDNTNNYICPYVKLPSDWDAYLNTCLSSNTRQKVRRFLRKVDNSEEYRITHATEATIEQDVETLLHFWTLRWGDRKGDGLKSIRNIVRVMLMHCVEKGLLFLPVLWNGDKPLGALASLVDMEKRSLLFYVGGRDKACNNPPPGFVLHAYSIRHAINNGFATYDFLRGNEPYKYSFGADECHIRHIVIHAKTRRPNLLRPANTARLQ
jgi:CelD/BcsL family acetyltransferase involved in cellulose biosynthesis